MNVIDLKDSDDESSVGNESDDLSDEEFLQVKERFAALLPKYGTLWRSMVQATNNNQPTMQRPHPFLETENDGNVSKDSEKAVCVGDCCKGITSFVPEYILDEKGDQEDKLEGEDDEKEQEPQSQHSDFIDFEETDAKEIWKTSQSSLNLETPRGEFTRDLVDTDDDEEEEEEEAKDNLTNTSAMASPPQAKSGSESSDNSQGSSSDSNSDSSESTRVVWDDWKSPEECLVEDAAEQSQSKRSIDIRENDNDSDGDTIPTVVNLVDKDESMESTKSLARSQNTAQTPAVELVIDDSSDNDTEENEWKDDNVEEEDDEEQSNSDPTRLLIDRLNQIDLLDSDDSLESCASEARPQASQKRQVSSTKSTKREFVRNRETRTQQLFAQYDREVCHGRLGVYTTVVWSNKLRTTAGLTRMQIKGGKKNAIIELSTKVLDSETRLQNTLLHELCHAAAFVIDHTTKPPHGPCFKKWAQRVMDRIPGSQVTTRHDYEIEYKYAWACTNANCSFLVQRHSRSVSVEKHVCGKCRGRLQEVQVPRNSFERASKTPRKKAPPSAYNRFVQEQSGVVRKRLMQDQHDGKVSQSEVMKECARLWREKRQEQENVSHALNGADTGDVDQQVDIMY